MENKNTNNETNVKYDFSSTVVMGENEFMDFNNATFTRTSTYSLIFLILSVIFSISVLILSPKDNDILYLYSLFMLVLMSCVFLITQKKVKDSYKKIVVSQGTDTITYKVYFGEKITAETDQHNPVEYDFSSITSVKETNLFYLLGLKYNIYIILQKDIKGDLGNVDFIEYIFNKCTNIKKKKVQKVMNAKKTNIIYLCCFTALFLFNLICSFA